MDNRERIKFNGKIVEILKLNDWRELSGKYIDLNLVGLFSEVKENLLSIDTDQKRILYFNFFVKEMKDSEDWIKEHIDKLPAGARINKHLKKTYFKVIDNWNTDINDLRNDFRLEKNSTSIQKPKPTNFYKTELSQKQTLLLAFLLKDNKVILPNTTNKFLAKNFGELTGYSATQLEKDLKGVKDPFDISDKKEDLDSLISVLEKLIEKIKEIKPQ